MRVHVCIVDKYMVDNRPELAEPWMAQSLISGQFPTKYGTVGERLGGSHE